MSINCHTSKLLFVFLIAGADVGVHSRLHAWKNVGSGDIKIFLAHLIAMGLVRQSTIERYWEHGDIVKTPFFGTYMSRNTFQGILSNLQCVDNALLLPQNHPDHDVLFKVRPFIDMMDRTFVQSFKPGRDLSFDEGCCPFKGRVKFRCYNPNKPAKFHMKLFEVTDAKTGYILGFDVYSGKNNGKSVTRCALNVKLFDKTCGQTTKVVIGLMDRSRLLDKGHHVYMDNYYTSPELFEELHGRETFACGTVRGNRKNLPIAVTGPKFKTVGDCVFRRNRALLCFKWHEKKDVTMLTTIHEAIMVETGKLNRLGEKIEKPEAVYYYCQRMGGVDLNDQLLNYYSFLRKTLKWSKKLLIHLFNMVILNAHILNKHYGSEKLTHDDYRDKLVKYLLHEGMKCYKIPLPPVLSRRIGRRSVDDCNEKRLAERHFPTNIPGGEGRKRKRPCRPCFVCNRLPGLEVQVTIKRTSFWCEDCGKPLCISPCFQLYHTRLDFKRCAIDFRMNDVAIPLAISP